MTEGQSEPEHQPIFSVAEIVGEVILESAGAAALITHLSQTNPNVFLLPAGVGLTAGGLVFGIYKVVRWLGIKNK